MAAGKSAAGLAVFCSFHLAVGSWSFVSYTLTRELAICLFAMLPLFL